jgi:anti-sigma factor ChrR (cupin superfamily)
MKEEPTTPDELLDEQSMLYALGSLMGEELKQFEACLHCPHSRATTRVASYTELVGTVSAALYPELPPSPELRARIMAATVPETPPAVSEKVSPPLPVSFLMQSEGQWHTTPYEGVRLRELSNASADLAIFMLHLDPGATFPDHDHHGSEDMYLLSGDLDINGTLMGAGDFMHSTAGSQHHDMRSTGGCRALVVTSRENYSSGIMRAYSTLDRVKTSVRRFLGKPKVAKS